ncbi:MAG: hypothetical protein CVU81_03040 [Euryarchaeota archaeon HGW-Euryarchaeota-1]|nr:MAG: hypothetical protein CVU81_03040 [Euryarchaeota archaeon HGW-Euryarchaeota-1]
MDYNDENIITGREAKLLVGFTTEFKNKKNKRGLYMENDFIGIMPRKDEIKDTEIKNIYIKICDALEERSKKEPDIEIKNKLKEGYLKENYEIRCFKYGEDYYSLRIGIKNDKGNSTYTIFYAIYFPHYEHKTGREKNDEKKYIMDLFNEIDEKYGKKNHPSSKTLGEEFLDRLDKFVNRKL